MKKILVPIDFSKQSEYAIKLAETIAKKTEAEVHLLHMVELPSGVVDMGAGSNFSIPESMMYLRMVKDKIIQIKNTFFDTTVTVHHSIRFQNPHEGILKHSKKIEPNLIVMGSKGASNFDEILIGSNTEKVVRTSKIPVLVAKNNPKSFQLKELVFASNFKEESKKSFAMFLDFATKFESNIHLLIVNTVGKFETTHVSKEKITNFLKEFSISKYSIHTYNDVSIEKGIVNFAKEINADLIALSTHGRSGLSHLFNGSISKNLTKSALRPVITFKI
ncbi:MAG: universal stress protein [Polaribacter sp.]|nr:universal stress protein [Polaribacter sp.]